MLFFIHYVLFTSGLSGTETLFGVYLKTYTDASKSEIGALLMSLPLAGIVTKPLFCSIADRRQAHRSFLISSLIVEIVGFAPFAIIPFFPAFYTQHPTISWYVLIVAGHIGNGGLAVGWTLGDCLAVNYSQKTGTPFGRMRLSGTISWGVYSFIIGQINETPALPKYTPAFMILLSSLMVEFVVVLLWSEEDFVMIDPLAKVDLSAGDSSSIGPKQEIFDGTSSPINCGGSMPSSLGGTVRVDPKAAGAIRDVLASDELHRRLKSVESVQATDRHAGEQKQQQQQNFENNTEIASKLELGRMVKGGSDDPAESDTIKRKNPQLLLLKMILKEDGRIIKYICLFTVLGALMSPMNFMFLSMEELCHQRGYNFSQLVGAVLISQALMETLTFFAVPSCMRYVSKSAAFSFAFAIVALKFIFYSGWYYQTDISPYWAVVSEWSLGLSYAIIVTIQADVSLMFANQCRLFIPEMRKLGYLSEAESCTKEQIEAEELSIKMALRATTQALFGGLLDGLGMSVGSLMCGIFVDLYSYVIMWKMLFVVTFVAFVLHLAVELSNSRWSDSFKPRRETKAFEIMQLSRAHEAAAQQQVGVAN